MRVFGKAIIFLGASLFVILALRELQQRHLDPLAAADRTSASPLQSTRPGEDADRPICGLRDDKKVHIPSNWESFAPPPAGQSYIDPVFGCSLKRLTDSSKDENAWDGKHVAFMNYYSSLTAINASDTMLFIVSNDGIWRIKDVNGKVIIPPSKMPAFGGHPIWAAFDGNIFYFASKNSLYEATVRGTYVKTRALHVFDEYRGIVSPDAADLSQDGDHIALVGQTSNNTLDVFVWSLSKQAKTSVYTTSCAFNGTIDIAAQPGCIHKLQLTADNLLDIQFTEDGAGPEQGLRLWNGSALVPLQNKTSHYDTGYDLNLNSVFVTQNNGKSLPNLTNACSSGWGIDVRLLHKLQSATCLLDHQPYWHISYRGGPSQPWVAVSFFDSRIPGPELFSKDSNYRMPTLSNWQLYEGELLLVRIDGAEIYRLAHTRSRSIESYWAQPHAAISRDGKYVVLTSNMAFSNGCPVDMHVANECSDVYLVKVR